MVNKRLLLMTMVVVLSLAVAMPALAQDRRANKGKPVKPPNETTENSFNLEITPTADFRGDASDTNATTHYIDARADVGDTCVKGTQQNTRGGRKNQSFGAFVDLDRGLTDVDRFDCNENHVPRVEDNDRRTVTMVINSKCACDVLVAATAVVDPHPRYDADNPPGADDPSFPEWGCTFTPNVAGAANGNPRVKASRVVGDDDSHTMLSIAWELPQTDTPGNSQLQSVNDVEFVSDGNRINFTTDSTDLFELWYRADISCPAFPFVADITFILGTVTTSQ